MWSKKMEATRTGDNRRRRSMPPTTSTDKHPPDNHRERLSHLRGSERTRTVEGRATEMVVKVCSPSSGTLSLRLAELAANTLETRKGIDMPIPSISRLLSLQSSTSDNDKGAPFVKRPRLTDGPEPPPNPQSTEQQAATILSQSRTSHIAHWAQQGQV